MNSPPGWPAPAEIALGLAALSLLPALIMAGTPFLRLIIVFHFLRQALGTQTAPSNQVLIGLALLLSFLALGPVAGQVYDQAVRPWESGQMAAGEAIGKAAAPMRQFWLRFAREKDIALLVELSRLPRPGREEDLGVQVLFPAYVLSELKAGFQIGAVLFLPFLVVDILVASLTLTVGMVQLPPAMVSAPLKVLLFVVVDGWNLVIGSLMLGLQQGSR